MKDVRNGPWFAQPDDTDRDIVIRIARA